MKIALKDRKTKWGWEVKTFDDLVLAVSGYPYFETVATCFIEEAVVSAAHDRSEWNDVREIAQHIAENYI